MHDIYVEAVLNAFHNTEIPFRRHLADTGARDTAASLGLDQRTKNTIVPKVANTYPKPIAIWS